MKKTNIILALSTILALTACNEKQEQAAQPKETVLEQAKHQADNHEANDHEEVGNEILSINKIFIRASGPGQDIAAAFFTMDNQSNEALEVKSISSNLSEATEFHTMKMEDNKMIMRKMEKVVIPSKGQLVLSPGADHIMLMNLKEPLAVDTNVTFTIEFTNGTTKEIHGTAENNEGMGHEKMNHKEMDHEKMSHEEMGHS